MMLSFRNFAKTYLPQLAGVKKLWKPLLSMVLICLFLVVSAPSAHAKRGGGRVGGSSFSRSRPKVRSNAPSRPNPSYAPSPYAPGGGFFFFPLFWGGGFSFGGVLGLLVLLAIVAVVLSAFRQSGITGDDSKVTVSKVQIGLLASARALQADLTQLALSADTDSPEGLAEVLRETSLSLLRHPEYWVYGCSAKENTTLALAEQKYQALALSERTKLNEEVLSNQQGKLRGSDLANPSEDLPSEYIVVTIVTAVSGQTLANLPTIRSTRDLEITLKALGSVPSDQLLAVEVLWEPQSEAYTLTSEELISAYPDLVRI
jgi:uncharacterized membrane protein